jgi:allantoin racemase
VSPFRLAVINPNTDDSDTAAMATAVADALPSGAEVEAYTAERGARSIESAVDEAFAIAEVVKVFQAHPDHDGYLIGCFSDPAVDALRELTTAPVVGIGEAAYAAAAMVAKRFAVITTLARSRPEIEDALRRCGAQGRCVAVLSLGIPVAEQGSEFPETTDAIIALGEHAVNHLGAEAIALGCGGMSDVERTVAAAVGVPATNGVVVGALMTHALWAAGLRTSKQGAYSAPEAIPYQGMPAVRDGLDARTEI